MRRREFLGSLGGVVAAWPVVAHAQQARMPRIGFLGYTTYLGVASRVEALRAGLRALGYNEGENLFIDFRWAEGRHDRLPELAAELVRLKADIIVTHSTPGTFAAKQAVPMVPVVMAVSGDAVASGLIASLARPGGNVTGSTFFSPELNGKRLELLKECAPRIVRVANLANPDNPNNAANAELMARTAASLKMTVRTYPVRSSNDVEKIFLAMVQDRTDALVVGDDAILLANVGVIAEGAIQNRVTAIGGTELSKVGGLMGYGVDFRALYRRAAVFVDKILKGTSPSDLPVEQPTKFEFVINLKTAKALGITVQPTLLARADEVIE